MTKHAASLRTPIEVTSQIQSQARHTKVEGGSNELSGHIADRHQQTCFSSPIKAAFTIPARDAMDGLQSVKLSSAELRAVQAE